MALRPGESIAQEMTADDSVTWAAIRKLNKLPNEIAHHKLDLSFTTLAGMRRGALDANWGSRKPDVLEVSLAE
jgi:hypothetical protein